MNVNDLMRAPALCLVFGIPRVNSDRENRELYTGIHDEILHESALLIDARVSLLDSCVFATPFDDVPRIVGVAEAEKTIANFIVKLLNATMRVVEMV